MSTAYRVHGGQYKDPNDFSTLLPGTEEDYGLYRTYEAAYRAWRGPAVAKIDVYNHRLLITPVEVSADDYDKLPA